ncbi:MAG TPA: DNA recombination protein RmuC [Acidobacteriota bacterium]|nr:DNA recombination protein RmuC [Acidobacteriota bacterium]
MNVILAFVAGAVFGVTLFLVIHLLRKREAGSLARELMNQTETEKVKDLDALMGRVRDSFGALSLEALKSNTGEFLKLANETLARQSHLGEKELEGKKKLIDQSLDGMKTDLRKVEDLMQSLEKDREQKFGQVASQLKHAAEQTTLLQETTQQLRQALSSTRARGQWGERMAEDVLRLSGFIEGVNYLKQKTLETAAGRPDYTFPLPQGRKVNMDVKFPLDNYVRFLESERDADRESLKAQFLRDVKARIKEVTTRDYINPEEDTLDYVLVFIPNEQVYAFINENDPSLIDEALRHKVVLCSPFTLYAILAIIRQAMDNFNLEETAGSMLKLMGTFHKQWGLFVRSMEKMGKKLEEAQSEFQGLTATRRNQLERPLRQIEELRQQRGLEAEPLTIDAEALPHEGDPPDGGRPPGEES